MRGMTLDGREAEKSSARKRRRFVSPLTGASERLQSRDIALATLANLSKLSGGKLKDWPKRDLAAAFDLAYPYVYERLGLLDSVARGLRRGA